MESNVGLCIEDSKRLIGKLMLESDFPEGVAALQQGRAPKFAGLGAGSDSTTEQEA
ncbi:hypothetical protein DR64_7661 [Paraburkholderia xenovorans LB400]|uniref:hypothetical protein n=1 Tax=Paraburkholderia xenovorans TaxID=36873 RepID=UPI000037F198|nr:hypothetical protein [Paraburkholderia xenovorans]AIP34933.1 hypothetical protein DR64_7661 [Paraburkholderia xenovorans LB400]